MTSGGTIIRTSRAYSRRKSDPDQRTWSVALEPAPPAPIAAATKNQQYNENDQKGCRVHVALLRTREPSPGSLHAISRREEVEWIASESTQVAMSCVSSP